jgi:hypothetical protein
MVANASQVTKKERTFLKTVLYPYYKIFYSTLDEISLNVSLS